MMPSLLHAQLLRCARTRFRPAFSALALSALALSSAVCCFVPIAAAYVNPTDRSPQAHNVLRGFDELEHNWHAGHRGVDLDLVPGSPVHAAGPGLVVFAGVVAGKPVVSLEHSGERGTFRTTYEPVHAEVRQGDVVTEGQRIGILGHSVDGYPGLHWGAKSGPDDYFNPLTLLEAPEIRLKPV